jgi:hypothetical protein
VTASDESSEGVPDRAGSSEGVPRSTADGPRRRPVLAVVVVVILAVDAILLAWTEMAWLTVRTEATGFPLPLSALVAAVTTPLLVLAADAAMPRSTALFAPLGTWTLTVVGAGLWSPAGAGVLPPDWRAVLLLAAGVLPALVVGMRRPGRYDPLPPGPGPVRQDTGDG